MSDNAWDRIGADPRLASARRRLSIHEIRLIIQHAQARHDAALRAIVAEPFGCVFCDSGKLRNPAKPHEDDCGFAMAAALVSEPSQS
jgi:hypothetical protein